MRHRVAPLRSTLPTVNRGIRAMRCQKIPLKKNKNKEKCAKKTTFYALNKNTPQAPIFQRLAGHSLVRTRTLSKGIKIRLSDFYKRLI